MADRMNKNRRTEREFRERGFLIIQFCTFKKTIAWQSIVLINQSIIGHSYLFVPCGVAVLSHFVCDPAVKIIFSLLECHAPIQNDTEFKKEGYMVAVMRYLLSPPVVNLTTNRLFHRSFISVSNRTLFIN